MNPLVEAISLIREMRSAISEEELKVKCTEFLNRFDAGPNVPYGNTQRLLQDIRNMSKDTLAKLEECEREIRYREEKK